MFKCTQHVLCCCLENDGSPLWVPLPQDTASVSPLVPTEQSPADTPPTSALQDIPPHQLAALASLLEAATSAAALQQPDAAMARLPSLQEWAPDSDPMQRLPSLQEWARVNSLGRGRPDRMPSVADWGRLANALGVPPGTPPGMIPPNPEAARRLLGDRAPSLTFHQPSEPTSFSPQLCNVRSSPVRNGAVQPMSPQLQGAPASPPRSVAGQVGRKRMATPEIVRAAETLLLRTVRSRVQ